MRTNTKKTRTYAAGALLIAAVLTLSACGSGEDSTASVTEVSNTGPRKAATVLDQPFTKPNLVLTDTHGKSYDLRKETKGKPTLIYFGYTNCPDICPLTMNNLAVAKKEAAKKLSQSEMANLRLVFVTTDPERDTPTELGKWLKGIDPEIVGLTGDFDEIQAGARTLGISINPPTKDKNGKTISEHGTQVIAFSPKTDGGYVLYGEDATVQDYEKDLPKLLKGQNP
ncbi:SCO family protein [Streptomyces ipomoeae]|uniref:SCO1/SenC n=2 Tax=Streptomyces ipomoeae TaxID=103232 RepID=L1KPA1_9ACTN|nr:SCO family protein [Streptomyces ipomoeae]EKX62213.1 SCO1/SenC [Streptomyces ipomoeae 91-03]MDX2693175.1 SCO family protein [Streptomyces ipomoeae]MDX2819887.1 SCO family protein [Streptomyces ipomoeae]MDX2838661.1 SCO family protein [Streptomyces ipomoeae]MDX2872291.1 SCO family protein [Streptomyces ipomoeae]